MYKITIEKTVGEVSNKTTIETDDVELVKTILEKNGNVSVESDVDNLNIDPEWQELLQWYHKKREEEEKTEAEKYNEVIEQFKKTMRQCERGPGQPFPKPYVSPFTTPYDPTNPFVVTC